MPFQCEFGVLMSYDFYTSLFEGTLPPRNEDVFGWFPIQTYPELIKALSLNPNGGQYWGLVMSELPCYKGLTISDKIFEWKKEEREREAELKRKVLEREKEMKKAKRIAKSENKAKDNGEQALIEDEKKREKNRKKKEKRREKEEMKEREEKTELSNSFTPLPPNDALAFETLSLESRDQPPFVNHSPPYVGEQEEGGEVPPTPSNGTIDEPVQYFFLVNNQFSASTL